MRKVFLIIVLIIVFAAGSGGMRWYRYVTNTESPYDEVGIELNSRMPYVLRKWGCDKLKTTFEGALPPVGCKSEDTPGRDWL